MTPLDNLIITHCFLTASDLTLSRCPNINQLKSVNLSGVTLNYSSSELLIALLEKVVATLQELYLEKCWIRDSHLEAILPAPNRCFQLTLLSMRENPLSTAIMEKTLQHSSELPSLSQELSLVPWESFISQGILQLGRHAQCRAELLEILKVLGHPNPTCFSSISGPHGGDDTFYHPEPFIYWGNIPAKLGAFVKSFLGNWKLRHSCIVSGQKSMVLEVCSMWIWEENVIQWGCKVAEGKFESRR